MSKEQGRNQPAKRGRTQEERNSERTRGRGGNESIQKFIIGQTTWHVDSGREQRVPSKQRPDVTFIFYRVFLSLIFFQFNYSTSLINRYDCRACNLCARHLICSGSGCRGALAGIVFSSFMMACAPDQLLPTSLFYHRGGFETGLCCLFFTLLPHFSVAEADLLKSRSTLFCTPRKADLWLCKAFFKMSLLHDVSHRQQH